MMVEMGRFKIECLRLCRMVGDRQNTKVLSITLVTVAGPLIAKADELPVHNRKGVRKSERKRRGGTLKLEQALSAHWATLCGCLGFLTFYNRNLV